MKKSYFIASIFALLAFATQAQDQNIVKISPITFLRGQFFMVHYERALTDNLSAAVGIGLTNGPSLIGALTYPSIEKTIGLAIDPELRYYLDPESPMKGMYLGLYGSVRNAKWESYRGGLIPVDVQDSLLVNVNQSRYIGGMQFGYQYVSDKGFVFDAYTGLGYSSRQLLVKDKRDIEVDRIKTDFLHFRLNVSIGYRF